MLRSVLKKIPPVTLLIASIVGLSAGNYHLSQENRRLRQGPSWHEVAQLRASVSRLQEDVYRHRRIAATLQQGQANVDSQGIRERSDLVRIAMLESENSGLKATIRALTEKKARPDSKKTGK